MDPTRNLSRAVTSASTKSFLSRHLPRRGKEQHDDPKGPLGLTTLHEPDLDEPVVADIIFVHGLDGGSQSTWCKGNNPDLYWPQEWLPMDDAFHGVRIHTFGYPSVITRQSVLNIRDFAWSLLAAVNESPAISKTEGLEPRLIFVAHSMGGLVVKKAYIIAHQEPEFQSVVERVCSIFFLATPHQGAGIAQALANIMSLAPGARPFIDDLLPSSPILQAINEDFPRLSSSLKLRSFFETRPMNIAARRVLIVEKTAAAMNLPNEQKTLLDADHRHVAMYASPNDSSFVAVRNALAAIVSSQRDSSRSHRQRVAYDDQAALNRYLGISDAPEDDLMTHECLPGSCEWIEGKDYYRSWIDTIGSMFLWLRGRPGAGKSALATRIIHDLRSRGMDCCFFFFKTGDTTKSNLNVLLRSLAWQMAMLHPAIMSRVKEAMEDGKGAAVDKIDPNAVWRMLFVSAILKVKLNRPQFWVIDAADECKGGTELMAFLARIQEQWPVSILVTSRDPVEAYLSNSNRHIDIHSQTISDEDSKRDIALFLRLNMELHRPHVAARWASREEMAAHIVENSGGCFLWASVICSELRHVTSEKEIEKVLDSVPSDMDALYSRILSDMSNARFGRDLAKAFIVWTAYGFRPLDTVEIQESIEMDVNDRIDDVETAISKCCGSLIYVDTHNRVRLIHATARAFLTTQGSPSEFIVTKAEGHRRLAVVCLEFLTQTEKNVPRPMKPSADSEHSAGTRPSLDSECSASNWTPRSTSFIHYASTYLFEHLNHVHSTDDEMLIKLATFLGSASVLRWIEFIATHGDLSTVYQAGKTINTLLSRRAQHSPPVGLARGSKKLSMLDQWGDDLIHLVTKFSRWLKGSPQSIRHLIPPFCPTGSAIRQQHSSLSRGLNVQGLSASGWDDCLTTITYSKGTKPNAIAAGPGFFAVGMLEPDGKIVVYDDSIFQEIHVLRHAEPVWRLAFSESGKHLASAGAKRVCIWSPVDGALAASFKIPSLCIAIGFEPDDSFLRVATKQNELIEWSVESQCYYHDETLSWTADLEETIQFRTPTMAALDCSSGLLLVIYRGENIVLWEYTNDQIYDVYEKDTGSISAYGSHKLAEGATTVRAVTISHAVDTSRLAATYTDGDLVVYNTAEGNVTAAVPGANTMLLSSSRDGRTLAGADSAGNVTLFEFETLRPLYRVQFDTQVLPKDLAFTADSRRFIEIRGEQCRVWEPSVLLRSDSPVEEGSDTVSVSTGPQEVDFRTAVAPNISAIACCRASSVVFVATEDGSVHAHDISAKPVSRQLFILTPDFPVHLLFFDERSSTLACADLSTRVSARKVIRRHIPRQQPAWEVEGEPLIDTRSPGHGHVKQIFASGIHSRLLVVTETSATLWPTPKQGEGVWTARIQVDRGVRWLTHPTRVDQLLCVDGSGVRIYSWADLGLVRVVRLSFLGRFERLAALQGSQFFATVSRPAGGDGRAKIQLWDSRDLENEPGDPSDPLAAANDLNGLSSNVELVIGAFETRLVVYTADFWIASVELTGSSADTFVRHFFLPADWISSVHKPIIGIGRSGEVLFAKRSELAVIKRGLEATESGDRFHPRRGRHQSRGAIMVSRNRRSSGVSVSSTSSSSHTVVEQ